MTRQRTWLEVASLTVDTLLKRRDLSAEVRSELGAIEQALHQYAEGERKGTVCHFVLRDDGEEELLLEAAVAAVPRIGDLVTIPGQPGRANERDTFIATEVEWVPHMQTAVVYFDCDPPAERVGGRHALRLIRGGKSGS